MPLVGVTREGERVCSLDVPDLRERYPTGSVRCPDCGGEFITRAGYVMIPHFAHRPGPDCKPMDPKPESPAHHAGKKAVREFLRKRYGDDAIVELEHRFPDVGRVADVCAILSNAYEVHEVQLASITQEQIDERTTDYERAGVGTIVWWLGGDNRRSTSLADFVLKRCGQYGELEVSSSRQTSALGVAA